MIKATAKNMKVSMTKQMITMQKNQKKIHRIRKRAEEGYRHHYPLQLIGERQVLLVPLKIKVSVDHATLSPVSQLSKVL